MSPSCRPTSRRLELVRLGVSVQTHFRNDTRNMYDGYGGDHMRISGVRDFRNRATGLLRSKDPVLVTRRGRLAGIFFPTPEVTLPIELKRELFPILSAESGVSSGVAA